MRKLPLVLGVLVLAATVAGLFVLANRAIETDYQNTFLQGLAVGVIGGLVSAIFLHVAAASAGRKWLVPGLVLSGMLIVVVLVRFEGFSGEMIPQLAWRWSPKFVPPPMKMDVGSLDSVNENSNDFTALASVGDETSASTSRTTFSSGTSLGFLGDDRDGIYAESFTLPASDQPVRQAWTVGVGEGWASFAVGDGVAVTIEQRLDEDGTSGLGDATSSQEWITAYDLRSGELRWKHNYPAYHFNALGGGGPRSTPQIDGDAVYVQGAVGDVTCLSLGDGQMRWHVDLMALARWSVEESESEIMWGRAGSPLIVDGLCVVPFGAPDDSEYADRRSLIALDKSTGDVVWTAGDDQISYASPQLIEFDDLAGDSVRQIVIVNERTISGHAVADGQPLWAIDWEGDSAGGANCASAVAAGDNRFLIGKGYGGGSALMQVSAIANGWSVDPLWTSSRVMKTKFNHAIVVGDFAYGISNGALEAIEIATAKRLWLQPRRDRSGQGQVILAGSTLIVQNEDGSLTFVAAMPDEYRELRQVDALHSKTWNIPTLAGDYLLVRNSQTAICFDLGTTE